jgi:hypothetical protein
VAVTVTLVAARRAAAEKNKKSNRDIGRQGVFMMRRKAILINQVAGNQSKTGRLFFRATCF